MNKLKEENFKQLAKYYLNIYGRISIPFLQNKLKISFESAKKIFESLTPKEKT